MMVARAKYNATNTAIRRIVKKLVNYGANRTVFNKYTHDTALHWLTRAALARPLSFPRIQDGVCVCIVLCCVRSHTQERHQT